MPLKITEFYESLNLKMFEKLSTRALCRFRSTCRQVDELCENQRYYLAGKRKNDVNISIEQRAGQLSVGRGHGRPHRFLKPFEELSALSVKVYIPIRQEYSAEHLDEVVSLMRRLKIMEHIFIYDSNPWHPEKCLDIISSCAFPEVKIICAELPYQKLLSLDSVKNAKRLLITSNQQDIPVEGFLKLIENKQEINLGVGRNRDIIIQNVIPQILKDVVSYQENDHVPRIMFEWDGLLDAKKIFPNHRPIYREMDSKFAKFSRYCYAMALPHKIFLVATWEFTLNEEKQIWTLSFLPYKKNALKQTLFELFKEPISVRILDHMFESLMMENK